MWINANGDVQIFPAPTGVQWRKATAEEKASWDAGTYKVPTQATPDAVDKERDKRLLFVDFQGRKYQTREQDQRRLQGAVTSAVMAKLGISPWDETFSWLDFDNKAVLMSADEVIAFGNAVVENERVHVFAANKLKQMTPIPKDFELDKYWPPNG